MTEIANRKRFCGSTSARESMIGACSSAKKKWVEKKRSDELVLLASFHPFIGYRQVLSSYGRAGKYGTHRWRAVVLLFTEI